MASSFSRTPSSSSSSTPLALVGLRQLMSLNAPRVSVSPFVKQEERSNSLSLSQSDPIRRVIKENKPLSPTKCPMVSSCSICNHASGNVAVFCDAQLISMLLHKGNSYPRHPEVLLCSVCRVTVTEWQKLNEEVEDIESRVTTVGKLRRQRHPASPDGEELCSPPDRRLQDQGSKEDEDFASLQPQGGEPRPTSFGSCKSEEEDQIDIKLEECQGPDLYKANDSGEIETNYSTFCQSSSSSFPLELRRLMTLDAPKVFLGQRCDVVVIKQEKPENQSQLPIHSVELMTEGDDEDSFFCSLCTHAPGIQHLNTLSFSVSARQEHLRSLLGTTRDEDLKFCSVCHHALRRLFHLREEMSDIESRIRAVVNVNLRDRSDGFQPLGNKGKASQPANKDADDFSWDLRTQSTFICQDDDEQEVIKTEPREETENFSDVGTSSSSEASFNVKNNRSCRRASKKKGSQVGPRRKVQLSDLPPIPEFKEGSRTLFRCPKCPKSSKFSRRRSVIRHLGRIHFLKVSSKRTFCPICKKILMNDIFKAHSHPDPKDPSIVSYTCAICSKGFEMSKQYSYHFNRNHKTRTKLAFATLSIESFSQGGRSSFRCPKCDNQFASKKSVYTHLSMVHGLKVARTQTCPTCKMVFRKADLFQAHSHPDPRDPRRVEYSCSLCDKVYGDPRILRNHNRETHLRKGQVPCPRCGKMLLTKIRLTRHLKTCSVSQEDRKKCHCGQVFATPAERLNHEREEHKGLASIQCYFCSKLFSDSGLGSHMRFHTQERPYVCNKCGNDFSDETNLRRHSIHVCGSAEGEDNRGNVLISSFEDEEGCIVFPCPKCPKTFSLETRVLEHLSGVHGLDVSVNKFCQICQKAFRRRATFKAHSHPDEKDATKVVYTCNLCEKTFASLKTLSSHKTQVHLKKARRLCPTCGKVYKSQESLKRHSRTCAVPIDDQRTCHCGKAFRNAAQRYEHERVIHKGLLSSKCYFCSKIPTRPSDLLAHMRIHTRERPFVCDNCGLDFSTSRALRYHRVKYH